MRRWCCQLPAAKGAQAPECVLAADSGSMSNLGQRFANGAAVIHVAAQLALMAALFNEFHGVVDQFSAKYPDWDTRKLAMMQFGGDAPQCAAGCTSDCQVGCSDAIALIKLELIRRHDMAKLFTFEGILQSIAALLAVFALLSLRTHMTPPGRANDERETIAFVCLFLGLFLPMLQFSMETGPIQYTARIGRDAQLSGDTSPDWSGFKDGDWKNLFVQQKIEDDRFRWVRTARMAPEYLTQLGNARSTGCSYTPRPAAQLYSTPVQPVPLSRVLRAGGSTAAAVTIEARAPYSYPGGHAHLLAACHRLLHALHARARAESRAIH